MITRHNKEGRAYALMIERDGERRAVEVNPVLLDALYHMKVGSFTGKLEVSLVEGNVATANLSLDARQLYRKPKAERRSLEAEGLEIRA